jgi:hypothetical protein
MSKLYQCAKGCGSIEETDEKKAPECCGEAMVEISEDEIFGCSGCCHCCGGCGTEEDEK